MKIVLVYNPYSGSSLQLTELKKHFTEANIEIVKTIDVTKNLKRRLVQHRNKHIVIVGYGGDGTLSSIAEALIGTSQTFAPLAGGTLNHFTKDLGIDQDLNAAIAAMKSAKPRHIDVAQINDRIFLNNSSIGLYPSSLQMRDEQERKNINKWVAAMIASFKAFIRYRSYIVEIDGERFKTPFVFVGNNDYRLEKRLIGSRVRIDGGKLSVYSVVAANQWSLFRVFIRAVVGNIKSVDEVKVWKVSSVTIKTRAKRIHLSRDGEYESISTPLEYKILPKSLKIIGGR